MLLVLATIIAVLFVFSSWVNRQVLDTDEWVDTSSELLENEEVRDALAIYLVDQLYANVDVEAELRAALPEQAKGLAGPAAGGLREVAERASRRALESPRTQALWEDLNRAAHEQFVAIVKDEQVGDVSASQGQVTLDLGRLVEQVGQRAGIGGNLADKLPPDAGQLTILQSDELDFAQEMADFIQALVVVLLVLGLGLYALAVFLARGRRRETLRAVGFSFIIAGLVALVLKSVAGGIVVGELAKTAAVEDAAQSVWDIATSLLSEITGNLIVNGIIILIAAWIAGRTRPATALRRAAAPYMRERPEVVYAVVGTIFLLLVAWGPTRAFRLPFSLLLIAILLVVGTEALRRQAAREFPGAALAEGEGLRDSLGRMRESVTQRVSDARARRAERRAEAPTAVTAVTPADAQLDRLERLATLRERGVLTEAEFERQKAELLGPSA